MAKEPLRVTTTFRAAKFAADLQRKMREIMNEEALEAADELQRASPSGATNELKEGWDIIPAKRRSSSLDIQVVIVNNAQNAEFRIRGRGPGKFPPFGDGSMLAMWARLKGIPPFLVARKIAREGTDRFQAGDGNNFAGLKRDGSFTNDSPSARAAQRISDRFTREL